MTRDLPFDDDNEAADRAGDTAYRVATGVARVARAGAYVTGGALVAANGGGVPAQPGESRLDSWNTGWAHSTDPDPDQPSPVITFPDPVELDPFPPHASNVPVAHGNPAPGIPLPGTGPAPAGFSLPTLGGEYNGTDAGLSLPTLGGEGGADAGMSLPSLPGGDAGANSMQVPGHSGGGVPGVGGIPGADSGFPGGSAIPGAHGNVSNGLSIPGARSESSRELDEPGGNGFGLPGHGLGQAGHGFGLPGANGFVAPGSTVFDLPGGSPVAATPTAGEPFDGIGAGGDQLGMFVGTQWSVDFGLGPNGIYFTSEMQVGLEVGKVGDQLDEYTDWLADGIRVPDGTDRAVTETQAPGPSTTGLLGGLGTPTTGTSAAQSSAASSAAQSSAASGAAQPLAASAPVGTAPVVSVAPAASVAPASAVAPAASVAPAAPMPAPAPAAVAAAPVVAVTPLQTTVQPDAASTPIANVLAAPEGPSVLTAPAASLPALFDAGRPAPAVKPAPVSDPQPSHPTQTPTTVTNPTTIIKTTPTPSIPGDVTTPSVPKTPDHGVTKLPGVTTPPHGGITTGPDVTTTKIPGATVTPAPTHGAPSTSDDDVTTPGGNTGRPSTGGTSHSTRPTNDIPSDDVPTVSRPSDPTFSVPDQPTYSAPAHAPTVEPYTPVPTHIAPAPTQPPVPIKPQVIDPKPQGISAPLAVDHPVADHTYDHSALLASRSGLSGALLPDSVIADTHHTASGVLDVSLL
ncbi:hypothetical protein AB0M45_14270 [Nocardia sp. NPDC051787]|uniref:hypothetical protein n=1 Tax=Nocardia sp. NPDC051787 TaxID=3155415 RepID=UPI003425ECF9